MLLLVGVVVLAVLALSMTNALRANNPTSRSMLRLSLAIAALAIAALCGSMYTRYTLSQGIAPFRVEQFYGVAAGMNAQGQFCIDNSTTGLRCAELRIEQGAELPRDGTPVRGGFAELPSDMESLEASWLWITELACGWEGTENATICP
jgi:hypothetical protein